MADIFNLNGDGGVAPARSKSSLWNLVQRAWTDPAQRGVLVGGLVCLALFCVLFRDNLWHFYYSWSTDENYSHGFLVPILSLYFANQIAGRGPVRIRGGVLFGSCLLVVSVLGRLVTIPLPIPFLGDIAFLAGLTGLCGLLFGAGVLRRYWFVFFFLLFMVPLPIALYSRLASPLQLLASRAASYVLSASGVPVLCEGNRMSLPGGIQMFVAEACSGMRQLTGFVALTAAVAYLSAQPAWHRLIIVLSALPIALTANITRIVLTGYIMRFLNPRYAAGMYHTLEGILMMGFGLLILSWICGLLRCVDPKSLSPLDAPRRPAHQPRVNTPPAMNSAV